ncbi:NAD(P)/FAD-dependent oxidoreductase [Caproiciproducens sp. NJN-50]|uniref:NAD(P)/FAD-dependent oxidoreductase n=1 Tax=Acutalibacteraceae TaxID=3082771 RepID=UPI000FFE0E85|nr:MULTISPECIES: FAD-dependent oxidoreductase [Acutalibacteraceae]QAT48437.1 NAD(P)/FAD-dependent oxidoreductase [Caproiciproducens sp. NJN-50]
MKYVIIGNSTAAVGCVEGIRSVDQEGPITVISDEPYPAYSRPLISYLLQGSTTEEKMRTRPADFYEKNGVTLLSGKKAVRIDDARKTVGLESGESLPYDRLLIAAGSRPFIPPMAGLDRVEKKFTFMKLDDAKALEAALTPESRVLIVGAGLIGLKCAEGIRGRAGSITVVDLADRILPSILDETGSKMMQEQIESNGIGFLLGDSVAEFGKDRAHLKSGKTVEFDLLVVAVGVRPNTELASQAGCEVGRGIAVDERSATSVPDIYAAGDCCECRDITTGQRRVLAILPNAYLQGEAAGVNMAGGEKSFANAVPMNAIGFFGLHVLTAGSYDGEEIVETKPGVYKKLVVKDNLLKGFILIGEIARAGIYTSLIREQTPLDTVDFDLLKQKPQLMAFTARRRAEKLGGAK